MGTAVEARRVAQMAGGGAGSMRALVQDGYGSADELHMREIATPVLLDDRVLVKVRAAAVNALDYHLMKGPIFVRMFSGWRKPKQPLRGVDFAGEVVAVGKNVTRFKPGDDVFGGAQGAFAEYVAARESGLARKPRNASFEEAATLNVAGQTALQGLRDKAELKAGQRVVVYGAGGGVGTFAVQIAKALGAHVTAVTGTANLETVRALGPDELVDYTREDITRRRDRFDVVFDVAAIRSFGDLRRVLKPSGVLVLTGADKRGGIAVLIRPAMGYLRRRFLKQRVIFFVAETRHEDLDFLRELVEAGKLRPAIERQYPFAEAAEAVRYLSSGKARAKVVITM